MPAEQPGESKRIYDASSYRRRILGNSILAGAKSRVIRGLDPRSDLWASAVLPDSRNAVVVEHQIPGDDWKVFDVFPVAFPPVAREELLSIALI